MGTHRLVSVVVLLLVILSGCNAQVASTVNVPEDGPVTMDVVVTVSGAAAEQLRDEGRLALVATAISQRAPGYAVSTEEVADSITWTIPGIIEADIARSAGVTGITNAVVTQRGNGAADVRLSLGSPVDLEAAYAATDDVEAIRVLRDNTTITVAVAFAGDVIEVQPSESATIDGNIASLSQTMSEFTPVTLNVSGKTQKPSSLLSARNIAGGLVIAVAAALVLSGLSGRRYS